MDIKKHHAFLLISERESVLDVFLKETLDFNPNNNLDYWSKDIETFGIEDSRELKTVHLRKAFKKGDKKVFVVKTRFFTLEAQNSLLKILEDPRPNSFFVFILPTKENIIPTLLSRFFLIEESPYAIKASSETELEFEISVFLELSPAARIKTLSKIISSKEKQIALVFLDKLEQFLRENIDFRSVENKNKIESFEIIMRSRTNLNVTGASIKMILENLCLVLPKI